MIKLRDYQIQLSDKGCKILKEKGIVYFAVAVRCGKTITSLQTAQNYQAKNVLFLTKKKAIESIQKDYDSCGFTFVHRLCLCIRLKWQSLHTEINSYINSSPIFA